MNLVIFNSACVCTYVFVMLSILQSQFPEKSITNTERFEDNLLLLLFLSTIRSLEFYVKSCRWAC